MSIKKNAPRSRKRANLVPATRLPLTRERVLEAGIALADERGLGPLSMRLLADALGVKAMSLYNHVAHKDDLIDGMVDIIAGRITLPVAGGDWKSAMRQRAVSAREVFLKHPWTPLLVVSRINIGPAMLRLIDATLGCLHAAGFSYEAADQAWNALDSHLYGFTLQELNFPLEPGRYASAARDFLPMLPAVQYPHMRALTESVISGRHSGLHDFQFGLNLLLDGLDATQSTPSDPGPSAGREPRG